MAKKAARNASKPVPPSPVRLVTRGRVEVSEGKFGSVVLTIGAEGGSREVFQIKYDLDNNSLCEELGTELNGKYVEVILSLSE